MPLVLPLLKLALALQSSWDTYKVLRPPRSSSQRAVAHRKRSMKGALSVWVVWAAVSIIERPLDNTIGFVMPFYGELKSLIFFSLLAFRAFVAEPIVLQVIRPFLKPYSKVLDGIIDVVAILASLVWSTVQRVLATPLAMCKSVWRRWDESPLLNVRIRPLSMLETQAESSDDDSGQTKDSSSASSQQPAGELEPELEQPVPTTRERKGLRRARSPQRSAQPSFADIDAAASEPQRFGSYSNNITAPSRSSSRASQRVPATTTSGSSRLPQQQQPHRKTSSSSTRSSQHSMQPQPQTGSANTTAGFHPELGQRRSSGGSITTAPAVSRRTSGGSSALPPSAFKTVPASELERRTYGASAAAAAEVAARMVDEPEPEPESAPLRLVGVVPDTPARFPGALPHGFDAPPAPVPMAPLVDEPEEEAPSPLSAHPDVEAESLVRPSRLASTGSLSSRASSVSSRTGSLKARPMPKSQSSTSSASSTRSAFPATLASTYTTSTTSTRPTTASGRAASLRSSSRQRTHPPASQRTASTGTLESQDAGSESDSARGSASDTSVTKKRRVARRAATVEHEQPDEFGALGSGTVREKALPALPVAAKPSNLKGSAVPAGTASLSRASSRSGTAPPVVRIGSLRGRTGTSASDGGSGRR